ncbi:PaaI family thioesterase [Pseudogracilibacillus sp. SE30717A]|uniref:PaaI family thioesterase n=1 Tax=Pseudogracilibacillus sp. SE30717A TaxID=3098293 RepID=UPI00300E5675
MSEKYTITDLQNVAKQLKSPPPCDETMQVHVHQAEAGNANGIWKVDRKFINGHGIVMGGFVSAAVDIMMAYAIASTLTEEEGFASIDLDTTFHRPTMEGEVEISAKVERRGRTIAYVTAEVKQGDKLVANCVSSLLITSLKK